MHETRVKGLDRFVLYRGFARVSVAVTTVVIIYGLGNASDAHSLKVHSLVEISSLLPG